MIAAFPPWGGAPTRFPGPWGWDSDPLLESPSKDIVKECVRPPAWQGVEPVTLTTVTLRPGWVVPRQVAQPSMAKRLRKLSTTKPQSIDSRRVAGVSKLATEMSEAEPLGRIHQVASKSARFTITNVSETVKELVPFGVYERLSVECSVRCPGHGGKSCTAGDHSKRGEVRKS